MNLFAKRTVGMKTILHEVMCPQHLLRERRKLTENTVISMRNDVARQLLPMSVQTRS
jgi:hypothetical protein